MKNKKLSKWLLPIKICLCLSFVFAIAFGLTACGDEQPQQPNLYSVVFAGGDGATGEAPTLEKTTAGAQITLPENTFEKNGYVFKAWNDGKADYLAGETYTMGAANVTFTAQWNQLLNVSFSLGEHAAQTETAPKTITGKLSGDVIKMPNAPQADTHYTFLGWSDGTSVYEPGSNYTISQTVTLSAVWQADKFPVSFDVMGATGTAPEAKEYDYKSQITLPEQGDLVKDGYVFRGWTDNFSTNTPLEGTYTIEGEVIFYAIWEKLCTITYSFEGHAAEGEVLPQTQTVESGTVITLPAAPKAADGYSFRNWKVGNYYRSPGDVYTVTENITIKANWDKLYSVSFNLGNRAAEDATVPETMSNLKTNDTIILPAAPKAADGYQFMGWDSSDGTYQPGETYTVGYKDYIFTALWDVKYTGTYTFVSNKFNLKQNMGGIYGYVKDIIKIEICLDEMTVKYTLHTSDGLKEYEKPMKVHTTSSIAAAEVMLDMTLKDDRYQFSVNVIMALWKDHSQIRIYEADSKFNSTTTNPIIVYPGYHVTFMNGETTVMIAPAYLSNNADGAVLDNLNQPDNPTKTGYTFLHWSFTENGEAVNIDSYVFTADTTLYAVWQANE